MALRGSFSVYERGGVAGVADVLRELKPAVLLLDLGLRRLGGINSLPSIQSLSRATKIILLTKAPSLREEVSGLKLGAKGYLGRDISEDLLRKAVRVVQRGELWTGRKVIQNLLTEVLTLNGTNRESPIPPTTLQLLTSKKREIIRHVAEGVTNKEIARRLNITEATVKSHLTAIFRRFALSNRVQLASLIPTQTKTLHSPFTLPNDNGNSCLSQHNR
jgi:two-component system nitrate/nitrite response regulator NarL